MRSDNPYEWGNRELIGAFMKASAEAGVSTSGLVIDLTSLDRVGEARFLSGVVLARLDEVQPPFKSGDTVRSRSELVSPASNRESWRSRQVPEKLTVAQVTYLGDQEWTITFRERTPETALDDDDGDHVYRCVNPLSFWASDFVLITSEAVAAVA